VGAVVTAAVEMDVHLDSVSAATTADAGFFVFLFLFSLLQVKKDEAAAAKVRAVVQKEEAVAKKEAAETEAIKADAQADLDQVCAAHVFELPFVIVA